MQAYQNPDLFSNSAITVMVPEPTYRWIPEMLDPPEHTTWRRLLRPLFTPTRAKDMRERIRQHCVAYLQDLLRTRERLAATIDGVDEWARADATPTEQEIARIRHLITMIKGDIEDLDDAERAQIDDAVAAVRRHRAAHAVPLGMPTVRPAVSTPLATTAATEATA